jgi:hypothetical protein
MQSTRSRPGNALPASALIEHRLVVDSLKSGRPNEWERQPIGHYERPDEFGAIASF